MRWEQFFADLEGQLQQAEGEELAAEVTDRTRRESALIRVPDRLVAVVGSEVVLGCRGAGQVTGRLTGVGPDWLLVEGGGRADVLVSTAAVQSVSGLGLATEVQGGKVWRALDLCWALRGLARSRVAVQAVLVDGAVWTGTVDRVGADHLELAVHPAGEVRRATAVQQVVLIPVAAIGVVRSLS